MQMDKTFQSYLFYFYLLVVGLLLLTFWLRIQNLGAFPPGLTNDEAVNAVDAFHLSRTGNFPLYEDPNRPEPLFRIVQGVDAIFFGPSVWAFRFTSVLVGVLTVAAAYWATVTGLYDLKPWLRRSAGLFAAASLAVAIGHITLSRSLYRAIPQPLFMLLFAGFFLRGLRFRRRLDFVWSAISLAAAVYSYTAALAIPATLGFVGLNLLIFQWKSWRTWLPNLILMGVVLAVFLAPIGLLFLNNPTAVLGRAGEVHKEGIDILAQIGRFARQFTIAGDVNPQYNVDQSPFLPAGFVSLFAVGLLALVIRLRQPGTALIAAFLILSAVPVIVANEIPHGLRSIGEYAAFPLVIGVGGALIVTLINYLPRKALTSLVVLAALAVITARNGLEARQTYNVYWNEPHLWKMYERELQHGEWFYRTDRRDLVRWMTAQEEPLLIPVEELAWATVHTWLMPAYPTITSATADFRIPKQTRLVVPWALETGDLLRDTREYALLQDGVITLLPPLSEATHDRLLRIIDGAEGVIRSTGDIDLVARTRLIPADLQLSYASYSVTGDPLAVFGDAELQLLGWYGSDTLAGKANTTLTYTLDWQGLKRMGHEYSALLQIQTQEGNGITGDDVRILRWLYPTTVWQPGVIVPDTHTLTLSDDLLPGAYRLVVGLYPFLTPDERLPIATADGQPLGETTVIGWLKVPQDEEPVLDDDFTLKGVTLGDVIALREVNAAQHEDGQIQLDLYWESLKQRPNLDATIFIHIVDGDGQMVAQQDIRPWGGQYPTFIWDQGEIVQTGHILDIGAADPDDLDLFVGMYTFPGPERLPIVHGGSDQPDGRIALGKLAALVDSSQ